MIDERLKLIKLESLINRVNAFGTDKNDEFTITREDDTVEGIFKVYAAPIIPFCETGSLEVFEQIIPEISNIIAKDKNKTFIDALEHIETPEAKQAIDILQSWTNKCLDKPLYFEETLRRARVESWLLDKSLATTFNNVPLSNNPEQKTAELITRLKTAFNASAPFYNLEAVVGDPEKFAWNPVTIAETFTTRLIASDSGKLDTYAVLLPALFKEYLTTSELDWNNVNWDKLKEVKSKIFENNSYHKKILLDISKDLGVSVEDTLFGINALEFIPNIGGKSTDMSSEDAQKRIENLTQGKPTMNNYEKIVDVGRGINALIRFYNWIPLIKNETNFKGENWTYAAVCDTANKLIDTLDKNPKLIREDFRETFTEILRPQIDNLDATSARGRFVLNLILNENILEQSMYDKLENPKIQNELSKQFIETDKESYIHSLGAGMQPRELIGGKAFGLEEIASNIGLENLSVPVRIPDGFVVTYKGLWSYLGELGLKEKVYELSYLDSFEDKRNLASKIRKDILTTKLPRELANRIHKNIKKDSIYAVRSSGIHEDTAQNGGSAGIYESILKKSPIDINSAIRYCFASFFTEKALSHRELEGYSDVPQFSILVQNMIDGAGGIAFSANPQNPEEKEIIINAGPSPEDIADGVSHGFSTYRIKEGEIVEANGPEYLPLEKIKQIGTLVSELKENFGRELDIEWVVKDNQIYLLQCRDLLMPAKEYLERTADNFLELNDGEELSSLEKELEKPGNYGIKLHGQRNLDAFQSSLFRSISKYGNNIEEIQTEDRVPETSHFANICSSYGIKLKRI